MGGELLSRSSGTNLFNYGTDNLGSVTALTGTDGSLERTYAYDPWGEEIASTGSAWYNPFRYTSTYLDGATDLYQMGARYYQPGTGRFTQLDPLGCTIDDGQRYGYAGANPANYVDPSGLYHNRRSGCHDWARYRDGSERFRINYGWSRSGCIHACQLLGVITVTRLAGWLTATAAAILGYVGEQAFGGGCTAMCNKITGNWQWTMDVYWTCWTSDGDIYRMRYRYSYRRGYW